MGLKNNDSNLSRKAELLVLAEKGNANAQFELGMLYKKGDANTSPNLIAAERWLIKAARQQHSQAADEIKKITTKPHLNQSAAIRFSHSKSSKTVKNIPNDQLRGVSDLLKKSHEKYQLGKVIPKSNVHTPLSDIYRKFNDNGQTELTESTESLPPTIRHLKKAKKNNKKEVQTIETNLDQYDALKILPVDILNEINQLKGLFDVKKFVTKLSFKVYHTTTMKKKHIEGFHTLLPNILFYGNHGCGISTISKIIQKIFHHFKLISTDHPIHIDVNELIKLKISQINGFIDTLFEDAASGVLVIENLDKLCSLDNHKQRHVIFESLVRHNSRNTDRVMIMASCKRHKAQKLNEIFSKLDILFQTTLQFDDLNPSELVEIYQSQLNQYNLSITAEALHYVNEIFQTIYQTRGHTFSNAHLVKSNLKKHINSLIERTKSDKNANKNIISLEDVEL